MTLNRLQFSIHIIAEKSTIWYALWNEYSYRDWVSVFFEGSYAVSDHWKEGSKVLFLGPDQSGIYSVIETHIQNKIISFKHIGNVLKGKEQPIDDDTKAWSGAKETYEVTTGKNGNILTVTIDVMDAHLNFMTNTFLKALEKVKTISLKND